MKKFILLSLDISGMGGGQMYQYNKLKFMKEHGYETYILYAVAGEILIRDFYNAAVLIHLPYLNVFPRLFTRRKLADLIDEITDKVGGIGQDTIIECDNKTTSLWGELIAKKNHCVSHILIIDEVIGSMDLETEKFFRFKRKEWLLRGAKDQTYEMLFGHMPEEDNYTYFLDFASNNVVMDIGCDLARENAKSYDLRICSIGRLDKDYVPDLAEEIRQFAARHPEQSVLFGMIGDATQPGRKEMIRNILKDSANLSLLLYGSMYPIPRKLIDSYDIFVSAAGSARVSGNLAVPTITIDVRDHKSIGIFGLTTENTLFRENEPAVPASELLEHVYSDYDEIRSQLTVRPDDDFEGIYNGHLAYYETLRPGSYFDVGNMKLTASRKAEKLIFTLLGMDRYLALKKEIFLRRHRA